MTIDEQIKELIRATREMRAAQKQYFLTRTKEMLQLSKGWEKKVDAMLAELDKLGEATPRQGNLFG